MTNTNTASASRLTTLAVPSDACLPDNAQWTNRFEIRSSSSSSVYRIAQHKTGRYWGCGCRGYIFAKKDSARGKTCKHLTTLNLAVRGESYTPIEVSFTPTPIVG